MLRLFLFASLIMLCGCQKKKPAEEPLKLVETLTVRPSSISKTIRLVGTVKAKRETRFIAQAEGVIAQINASDGEAVLENRLIAELSSPELAERLALAKKMTRIADANFARMKKLHGVGDISRKTYEEAEHKLLAAKGDEKRAALELKKMRFTAPFAGVLTTFKAHEGSHLATGEEIVALYDPKSLFVEFHIPEDILSQVNVGQKVQLKDQTTGLSAVNTVIDPKTHMGTARAPLPVDARLSLQSIIEASIEIERHDHALVLPREAVFLQDGKPHIVVVKNGLAKRMLVTEGIKTLNDIEILNGLSDGDIVITRAQSRIADDERVRVSP